MCAVAIGLGVVSCKKEMSQDLIANSSVTNVQNPNNKTLLTSLFSAKYTLSNNSMNKAGGGNVLAIKMPVRHNGMLKFPCKGDFDLFIDAIKDIDANWIRENETPDIIHVQPNEALDAIETRLRHNSFRKVVEARLEQQLALGGIPGETNENPTYVKDKYLQSVLNADLEVQIANAVYKYDPVKNDHYPVVIKPNGQQQALMRQGGNGPFGGEDDTLCECIGIEYLERDPCGNWALQDTTPYYWNSNGGGKSLGAIGTNTSNNNLCSITISKITTKSLNGCFNSNIEFSFYVAIDNYLQNSTDKVRSVIDFGDGSANQEVYSDHLEVVTVNHDYSALSFTGDIRNFNITSSNLNSPCKKADTLLSPIFDLADINVRIGPNTSETCDKANNLRSTGTFNYAPNRKVDCQIVQNNTFLSKSLQALMQHYVFYSGSWHQRDVGRVSGFGSGLKNNSYLRVWLAGKAWKDDCVNVDNNVENYNEKGKLWSHVDCEYKMHTRNFGTKTGEVNAAFSVIYDNVEYTQQKLYFNAPQPKCD